jgi:PKHD-type hydroxylase
MQLKNYYYYFKSALSTETCQKIIDLGLDRIEKQKNEGIDEYASTAGGFDKQSMPNAKPIGDKTFAEVNDGKNLYVRDSKVSWLNEQWIYDEVYPLIEEANKNAGWNYDYDISEAFQFTIYEPEGFYGWHADGDGDHYAKYRRYIEGITPVPRRPDGRLPNGYVKDPKLIGKVRKISMTINLNAPGEYEGGNLKFDFGPHAENRYHECEEIRPQGSVIIFPSFVHHCVTPITKGTRYSLVLWTCGEPFK